MEWRGVSQKDLVDLLQGHGVSITQGTISHLISGLTPEPKLRLALALESLTKEPRPDGATFETPIAASEWLTAA